MNKLGGLAQKMPPPHSPGYRHWQHDGHSLMSGFAANGCSTPRHCRQAGPSPHGSWASVSYRLPRSQGHQRSLPRPLTEATKDAHESPPTMVWGMGLAGPQAASCSASPATGRQLLINPYGRAFTQRCSSHLVRLRRRGHFSTPRTVAQLSPSFLVHHLRPRYASRQTRQQSPHCGARNRFWWRIFTGGEPLSDQADSLRHFSSIFFRNWA